MHISLVNHVPYQFHGLLDLSIFMANYGWKITELTWSGSKSSYVEQKNINLTRYFLPGFNFSLAPIIDSYPYILYLSKLIKNINPDIVHAQNHLFLPTLQAIRTAKKINIPRVVTVHGVFAERNYVLTLAQKFYLRTFGLEIFNKSDKIICLTRNDSKEIIDLGCPEKKIELVPNGIDTDVFSPGNDEESDLIIWVGRFVPEKGIEYLIRAAKIVAAKHKTVKFLLIGHGYLRNSMEKLSNDLGLRNIISFIGPLEKEEVSKCLKKASIFVFPSLKEGMPIALLEAMSSGNAILASKISAVEEILEENIDCLFFTPKNEKELASKLLLLLNDKALRKKFSLNVRKKALKLYSWPIVLDKLKDIYMDLI